MNTNPSLAELDLTTPHGHTQARGIGQGLYGMPKVSWLLDEDQGRARIDNAIIRGATSKATKAELAAWLRERGGFVDCDATKADLACSVFCKVIVAWWPYKLAEVA